MSVFEQKLSFRMFYFITSDHGIVLKCRWGSPGTVSSATGSWWSPSGGSRGKAPDIS